MPRGSKPGERRGGRKTGTPNKASIARQKQVASTGKTPLEAMIETYRWLLNLAAAEEKEAQPDKVAIRRDKIEAAKIAADCAKYVHPALAATTLKGDPEKPITHKLEIEFV